MLKRIGSVVLVISLSIVAFSAHAFGTESGLATTPTAATSSTVDPTSTLDSTTTTQSTVPPSLATRGSSIQETPTDPPPPSTTTTVAPPVTPPPAPNPNVIPGNSGAGRRVIYSKGRMRLWVVDANGSLVRTYLVSGRLNQPNYGTYSVYSRSSYTCNIKHSNVCMRWMVRFAKGPSGDNIGFHEIPRKSGVPIQSDRQLGQALSSGCVRQSTGDAMFMWGWAGIGTKVVVIP